MGFQDFSPGNGWRSRNSALKMEQSVQPRLLMTGLENQNNELCCEQRGLEVPDCTRALVARVCLQHSTSPWIPPALTGTSRTEISPGHLGLGSLLLPGAAHPLEMAHPWSILPSISISLSLQMHVLVQGGSAGADQELASALSLISWCFSASLGAATSDSR